MNADYEYRVTGCAGGGWRRTEWRTREQALEDYETACDNWDGVVGFERRTPGDDKTIQRRTEPDSGNWIDVTEDKIHFEDEKVKPA
ncbi:hypothetical protein [Natronorubrum thiooxidans]|uniref:Uncharacterized protein n=1 Tax=Natronorubrum thiooxidans TaxID=308853 RepID=A0A1N7HAG3_9EURY|nr:hypothetical protein [Natronorubrum thiooxidans]SIS21763.1 hypothetical protein SAMN05421752_14013 [Natronorubrum thiooxidans]